MKIYRCFIDIKAENKEDALTKLNEHTSDITPFRIQENPFNDEEEGNILEIANRALLDNRFYLYLADQLDLPDKELNKLLNKIEAIINR